MHSMEYLQGLALTPSALESCEWRTKRF